MLFKGLPQTVVEKAAAQAIVRRLNPGEMLFSEYEEAAGLFIVVEGDFRSIRQNSHGREQVLATERPGATFAEAAVFDGGTYFSTVIADTSGVVLCIPRDAVRQICHDHPELLWNAARVLSDHLRACATLIESLALRNVDQRLALLLLHVIEERSVRSGEGVVFELTMTRPEIANRIGSVREVVSRSLSHLHDLGLIELRGKRLIMVSNVEALRRFAGAAAESEHAPSRDRS
jgi:CRP/FNR family transcriptional regulator, dissimilatory nitrate respiration regulator